MKKVDYFKELREAEFIPFISMDKTIDDYTYEELRSLYKDMRSVEGETEEDVEDLGVDRLNEEEVIQESIEKANMEERVNPNINQVGTTEWKLIAMVSRPRDAYKHIMTGMEYSGGVLLKVVEKYGNAITSVLLDKPGATLRQDTEETWKIL